MSPLGPEYLDYDALGLAELVRNNEVTPRELAETAIARIEASDELINAVSHPLFEQALGAADGELPDGPFRGAPFLMKDLCGWIGGQPMHCGSAVLRDLDLNAPHDSYTGKRCLDAGLVVLGRSNSAEFGLTGTTEPVAFGVTRNPWDPELSAGGSSGGAAAAIAAGYVPATHAGDGGGSVRIPASVTGLVGLKPSRGRFSSGPDVEEYLAGFGSDAFLSRTVRDAAALLDVGAGYNLGDAYTAPPPPRPFREEVGADPGRLRVGVMPSPKQVTVDPECAEAANVAAAALARLGHDVESRWPAALDELDVMTDVYMTLFSTQASSSVAAIEASTGQVLDSDRFEPLTTYHLLRGREVSADEYLLARGRVHLFRLELTSWWGLEGFDLLVVPTLTKAPFPLGEMVFDPAEPEASQRRLVELIWNMIPFNMSGQPAISLPLHWSDAGLPIGVELVAAPNREDLLVQVASQLEDELPWADRRPAMLSDS